jgi:uncharacterized protein YkwD
LKASLALLFVVVFAVWLLSIALPQAQAVLTSNNGIVTVVAPVIRNHKGQELEQVKQGSVVDLRYLVKNRSLEDYDSTLIVEVIDSNQFTDDLQQHNKILARFSDVAMNTSWIADKNGEYEIRSFMIAHPAYPSSFGPRPLSAVNVLKISVGKQEVIRVASPFIRSASSTVVTRDKAVVLESSTDSALAELKQYALRTINQDRAKFGLSPVIMSNNPAAQVHANDVLKTRAISHWMTDGEKPYMTYTRLGGDGKVTQNVAIAGYGDQYDGCISGVYRCDKIDPHEAIATTEYQMMYNDTDCCDNGHRKNILDKFHTHVSIGIAYNDYFFVMVQNFENQYTIWNDKINDNNNSDSDNSDKTMITMAGSFTNNTDSNPDNDLALENVQVFYDPLPTPEIYQEHKNDRSYGPGKFIGLVVEPLPPGMYYKTPSNFTLVEAQKWNNSTSEFNIDFSLDTLFDKYGNGVYTIVVLAKDTEGEFLVTSEISVFLD